MREAFDDALVSGWEDLEGGLSLPDQDDRHVLAAAIRGGAQAIITANANPVCQTRMRHQGYMRSL